MTCACEQWPLLRRPNPAHQVSRGHVQPLAGSGYARGRLPALPRRRLLPGGRGLHHTLQRRHLQQQDRRLPRGQLHHLRRRLLLHRHPHPHPLPARSSKKLPKSTLFGQWRGYDALYKQVPSGPPQAASTSTAAPRAPSPCTAAAAAPRAPSAPSAPSAASRAARSWPTAPHARAATARPSAPSPPPSAPSTPSPPRAPQASSAAAARYLWLI
jgi:hypothetical protein